jgi:hypothetical protein
MFPEMLLVGKYMWLTFYSLLNFSLFSYFYCFIETSPVNNGWSTSGGTRNTVWEAMIRRKLEASYYSYLVRFLVFTMSGKFVSHAYEDKMGRLSMTENKMLLKAFEIGALHNRMKQKLA